RRKRDVNITWISEVDLVVVPAVAGMGQDIAASSSCGLQWARAEQPVAKIDDVDILLDKYVSGEGSVPKPIAEAVFVCRGSGAGLLLRSRCVVVGSNGGDLAQRTCFDSLGDGSDRRRTATLEAHIDALPRLHAFCDYERLPGLADVDADGLFAIDVFA